ncbi:Alpha/Beta hydrolase protein [Favolaschia claudopus]|uniref:Carboxylic ester hydrolase n=1 Tax=Favolaschia claudopus TaxID=2862362 RepID=A0AAW0C0M6_9AGAR
MGLFPLISASFLLLLLSSVYSVNAGTTPKNPVVDLGYARYQGVLDTNLSIAAFRGIRYGAPPTGSLRFQAPAVPPHIAGIQPAVEDPPQCYQGAFGASPTNSFASRDEADPVQTEDCLFLSVYTPALNSTVPLPTVVWIHGGGFALGGANQYNGAELVQESDNKVVAVTINYRLGLFGFLAGQEVKDGGAVNAGLLDQEFALKLGSEECKSTVFFMKAHRTHTSLQIHKFGGDPSKVTIWGQSAGAGSVSPTYHCS